MTKFLTSSLLLLAATTGLFVQSADAGDRRFVYVYEATTAPKGTWEYEQWVTWKAFRGDVNKNRFDFRHELEYAFTDRLQVGLYLSDWRLETGDGGDKADWRSAGIEAIYNLTNPTTDFLGSALYGEVKLGDELFVLEGKLLLQKNIGKWMFAYNAIVEAEWEGAGYEEEIGVLEQTLGVSYQVDTNFSVGVEALHEVEFENWDESGDNVVYVGPNVSFRGKGWFATAAALFEVTGVDGEAEVQTRLIFGVHF